MSGDLDLLSQPLPDDRDEQARWEHTALRARMLDGQWKEDALDRYAEFFNPLVRSLIPNTDISTNPFLALSEQQAVLYDEDPAVRLVDAGDEGALELLLTEEIWPVMVEALPRLIGLHEQICYVDVDGRGQPIYEMIDPHWITGTADPDDPGQLATVRWLRVRRNPRTGRDEWTWDVWDLARGEFRIDAEREGGLVDATAEHWPEAAGTWPRVDLVGQPVLPFVVYHDRLRRELWKPYRGREVVEGTLNASALRGMWLMGVRDSAHPQRNAIDLEIQHAELGVNQDGVQSGYVAMAPNVVLQWRSRKDRQGSLVTLPPGMDPKAAGEAIDGYVRELAIYAGVSPSDLQVASGQSGIAIRLTRDGQRRAQRRLQPGVRHGDRLKLALAAKLVNAAQRRAVLPEDPAAYAVEYVGLKLTPEEVQARNEEADILRRAGVISPAEHYRRFHPEATEEEALAALVEAARQEAMLAAVRQGTPGVAGAPAATGREAAERIAAALALLSGVEGAQEAETILAAALAATPQGGENA